LQFSIEYSEAAIKHFNLKPQKPKKIFSNKPRFFSPSKVIRDAGFSMCGITAIYERKREESPTPVESHSIRLDVTLRYAGARFRVNCCQ